MKWFYNLQTNLKLIASFLIMAILIAFVGIFGLSNMGRINDSLDDMYTNQLGSIQPLLQAELTFNGLRNEIRKQYMATDDRVRRQIAEDYPSHKQTINDHIATFRGTQLNAASQEELPSLLSKLEAYFQLYEQAIDLGLSGKLDEMAVLINGELTTQTAEVANTMNRIVDFNIVEAKESRDAGANLFKSSRAITIGVIVAAIALSILFGYFIARAIAVPLNRVAGLVEKVADGDLQETVNYEAKDEIGVLSQAIDAMVLNLRRIVGNILNQSQSLAAASQQISATTEEIAGSSSSQAEAAQTIHELFQELTSVIQTVAVNTEHAAELSNETIHIAREGGEVIRTSMESMDSVRNTMSRLEDDSLKIGEIIEVIEDIADQTNLLALNAAIEAARAGDQGRGFAVVADEVRKLAERSSEATKQITTIIKGMQEHTKMSVDAVQESAEFSHKTSESFHHIAQKVNEAGEKVTEIAAASEEQAAQASTVMEAVESVTAGTEESAAASEETAATAQSLAVIAEELRQSVAVFKI